MLRCYGKKREMRWSHRAVPPCTCRCVLWSTLSEGKSVLFLGMPAHLFQIWNMLQYPLKGKWICCMLLTHSLCSRPVIYLTKIVRNHWAFRIALLILAGVKQTTSGGISSVRTWWMTQRKRKDLKEVWLSNELIKIKILESHLKANFRTAILFLNYILCKGITSF